MESSCRLRQIILDNSFIDLQFFNSKIRDKQFVANYLRMGYFSHHIICHIISSIIKINGQFFDERSDKVERVEIRVKYYSLNNYVKKIVCHFILNSHQFNPHTSILNPQSSNLKFHTSNLKSPTLPAVAGR